MGWLSSLIGGIEGVGGPSTQEQTVQQDEMSFMNNLSSDFSYLFDNQVQALNTVKGAYQSMVGLGPDQHGFSGPMLAALNTQAIESNAAAYEKSAQALRSSFAGQGGGGEGLTTGTAAELQGALASAFAGNLSQEQLGITLKDYDVGRQNYLTGLTGETDIAKMTGTEAEGFAGLEEKEQGQAFDTSKTIKAQQDSVTNELINGAVGLGTVAAQPLAGLASQGLSAMFPNMDTSFLDSFAGGNQ